MEEPTHIGDRLKQARNKKGYTLDDLQQLTKIQKRYLIAIEENRLEDLPGTFFVNAFIRQYAEVVGVAWEQEYTENNNHLESDYSDTFESKEKVLPTRSELKRSSRETQFTYSNDSKNNLPTFLLVLMFLLILGTIWFYIFYLRDNDKGTTSDGSQSQQIIQTQSSESLTESDTEMEEPEEVPQTTTSITGPDEQAAGPTYTITDLELPTIMTIEVSETGSSWVSVMTADNDLPLFEGTISGGSTQEIPLEAGITQVSVRIGYLPSTTVKFDDIEVSLPADYQTNQTQTLIFNIE